MKRSFTINEWVCHYLKKKPFYFWFLYPAFYVILLSLKHAVIRKMRLSEERNETV